MQAYVELGKDDYLELVDVEKKQVVIELADFEQSHPILFDLFYSNIRVTMDIWLEVMDRIVGNVYPECEPVLVSCRVILPAILPTIYYSSALCMSNIHI